MKLKLAKTERKKLRDWPRPTNLSELRGFIGILKIFRRFIKQLSHLAAPLTTLTRKGSGMYLWNDHCTKGFNDLKYIFLSCSSDAASQLG